MRHGRYGLCRALYRLLCICRYPKSQHLTMPLDTNCSILIHITASLTNIRKHNMQLLMLKFNTFYDKQFNTLLIHYTTGLFIGMVLYKLLAVIGLLRHSRVDRPKSENNSTEKEQIFQLNSAAPPEARQRKIMRNLPPSSHRVSRRGLPKSKTYNFRPRA